MEAHIGALLDAAEAGRAGQMPLRMLPTLLARVPLDAGQARRVAAWRLPLLDRHGL